MQGVYERLIEAFDPDDEPPIAARRFLEILRQPDSSVIAVGIEAAAWCDAIDAILGTADAFDAIQEEEEANLRRQSWKTMRTQLEQIGCRLWQLNGNSDWWRIEAPGVQLDVDLASGEIEDLEEHPYDSSTVFSELPKLIGAAIDHKLGATARRARLAQLRLNHRWEKARKAWVPISGDGPMIPGGGALTP